jgi:hypothetical protein
MDLRQWLTMLFTDPNSAKGLIIRAEKLEKDALKPNQPKKENLILYAKCLRELAKKNWTPKQNKKWIKENLRSR